MNTQNEQIGFTPDSVRTQFVILAVSWWIGFPLSIVGTLENLYPLALLCVPAIIVATVFWCILLYRHWSLLQGHGARSTPGKAVGYGFIPIFWFYWWYYAYVGLAEDNNRYLTECGITPLRMSRGLAVTYYILNVCGITLGLIPIVGAVLTIPFMIIGFILAQQQRDCILAIMQHRSDSSIVG
jgi:hypothetical protein